MELFEAYNNFIFEDPDGVIAGRIRRNVDKGSIWKFLGNNSNFVFIECVKSSYTDLHGVQIGLEVNTFNKHFTKLKA